MTDVEEKREDDKAAVSEYLKRERIAALNDALRTTFQGGRALVTPGVQQSGRMADVLEAVRRYDFSAADPGDDPYGERDFGSVSVGGDRYFFKIDYYDLQLQYHSPDPTDASKTRRVLTIMRADEY